ncbi:MAG: hypothetical protein C0625_08005 [Arcobacter sp.]|nr:MAG: hypothetical protein C0625_08005 [Arcobacter sp.]
MDGILTLNNILKSGLSATDATLSGSLTPKQGKLFVSTIVSSHALLSKVTTDITGKLTKERSGWDAAKGMLTRHKSGTKAPDANLKKLGKIGCNLDMTKGVELNAKILDEAIEDNQDNTNFEKEQFESFTTIFSNDLQYLGVVGTADNDDHEAPFTELAKGWLQIARESGTVNKPTSSNNSILYRLKHLVKNAHDDVKGSATILMSSADYMDYQFEIAEKYQDLATLLKADKKSFMDMPIETSPDLTNGEYLLTPLQNMIFGISSRVKRNRWYDNDESALKYKFVVFPDYEFDVHKYVTLLTITEFTITGYTVDVAVGANVQRTVQSAAGNGVSGVTVVSNDPGVATVTYDSATGVILTTGVAVGVTTLTVDDGTSTKTIDVVVTA